MDYDDDSGTGTPPTGGGESNTDSQNPDQIVPSVIPPTEAGPSNRGSGILARSNVSGLPPTSGGQSNTDSWIHGETSLNAGREYLQFSIVCAHNLYNVRRSGIMNPRAVYFLTRPEKNETPTDFEGGTEPLWNSLVHLSAEVVSAQTRNLTIEIYDCVSGEERQLIGTAQMPLSDLLGAYGGREFFAYCVWTPTLTQFQGEIHVTVRRVREAAPPTGQAAHD